MNYVKAVLAGLIATAMLAVPAKSGAATSDNPVVFVHGFVLGAPCPGINAVGQALDLTSELAERGYTGPLIGVEYYACDSNGADITTYGEHGVYFESGEWTNNQGWGTYQSNTNNTDIRHIAYQLAWYIHDEHTSQGQPVNAVGYSMGGLILRWALYQIAAGNPLFPPSLLVENAVTISTPHRGITPGLDYPIWCGSSAQCNQMRAGSTFLAELNSGLGLNPQGTGGTDWTALGSRKCDIITEVQSTDMGDVHKVVYDGVKPKCYSHTGYLTDRSDLLDMPVRFRHPGQVGMTATSVGAHSLAWVVSALSGAAW